MDFEKSMDFEKCMDFFQNVRNCMCMVCVGHTVSSSVYRGPYILTQMQIMACHLFGAKP